MTWDSVTLVGQTLGEYDLEGFLGEGAFGAVYNGTHAPSGERVALKVLKPGANVQAHQEFTNEGDLLVKLASASHVLDIYDTQIATVAVTLLGGAVMAVPLSFHVIEEADVCLSKMIVRLDELNWPGRLSIFRDVVLGVHQMHSRGVVHRDVKSDNVLLFGSGTTVTAKLNDLGRARDLATTAAVGVDYEFGRGDPSFAAPEFLWGAGVEERQAHVAADLYGLGSLLFELCVGVGITGMAVFPNAAVVGPHRGLPANERVRTYRARIPEVRTWYEPMFGMAAQEVPKSIRQEAGYLMRQLCDADPTLRFPRVAIGRRGARANDLQWLLNRVDSMRLAMRNADREAARLLSRKQSR